MKRTQYSRRRALGLSLGGIAALASEGGVRHAVAQAPPDTVVYVSNAGDPSISILAMDRTSGDLTPIDTMAIPGTDKPSPASVPLALTPDRRFVYAALRSEPFSAASFAVDPASGKLRHLGTGPIPASMAYIITDRTGRFLLEASYPQSLLAISPIGADHQIGGTPTQVFHTKPKAHCVLVDASNAYAYCTNLGGDVILQLKFDAAKGTVSPNTPAEISTKAGAGPRHMAFHPTGRFLFLITETTATIGSYSIDKATGTLKEIGFVDMLDPSFKEQPAAADLHVTPDGRFLYGSERKTSTLTGFRIDAETGRLSPIGRWPTETTPRGFNIDPRGKFLLAAGLDSNHLTVYAIGGDGTLKAVKQHAMGKQPNWVEFVDLK